MRRLILSLALFGCASPTKPPEQPQTFEYATPKDWYLDSTMTERRHIYYETQYKMK